MKELLFYTWDHHFSLTSVGAAVADELQGLFAGELNPVAAKAQRKVPIPEG